MRACLKLIAERLYTLVAVPPLAAVRVPLYRVPCERRREAGKPVHRWTARRWLEKFKQRNNQTSCGDLKADNPDEQLILAHGNLGLQVSKTDLHILAQPINFGVDLGVKPLLNAIDLGVKPLLNAIDLGVESTFTALHLGDKIALEHGKIVFGNDFTIADSKQGRDRFRLRGGELDGLQLFGGGKRVEHQTSLCTLYRRFCFIAPEADGRKPRILYGWKTPVIAMLLALLAFATPAHALDTPTPAPADARVRFVNYRPYDVTKVVGTLFSSLQLEFAPDEEIANVVVGNTVAWEVAPAGNILFLKPREQHPLTNLQVVTTRRDGSRRSYQLELTIRAGSVDRASGTYFLVKYRYPEDEAIARRQKQAADAAARAADNEASFVESTFEMYEDYGPRNWHYSAQGARAIEPSSVYDNGKTTTFTFKGVAEIPAIYLVNTDGSESLVPKSVEGSLVRVHALGRKFVLRRGKDVLCVFNDAFMASGIEPGTSTVSPSIARVVKGSAK